MQIYTPPGRVAGVLAGKFLHFHHGGFAFGAGKHMACKVGRL